MAEDATASIERQLERAGLAALHRPAWLEVDLGALESNARVLGTLAGPGVRLALATKANAYGHGMEMASRAAILGGAGCLVLATLDEAVRLRASGIACDLLVVYPVAPEPAIVAEAARLRVDITAGNARATAALLAAWNKAVRSGSSRELRVHLEVDSGMTRGGADPDGAAAVARALLAEPGVRFAGAWTHLASPADAEASREQVARFEHALGSLRLAGIALPLRHVASSAAVLGGTCPPYEMVRVGLSYYGMVDPAVLALREAAEAASRLHPALALKARAVRIEHVSPGERVGYGATWEARRASQIATLPVGYGDGYARAWSPGACALVRGTRVPLVGAVSMDSLTVDVTDVPGCDPGEEFVLLGSQGGDCVTADELATIRRTISYEVTTGFGSRLPRIYRDGPEIAALLDASNRLTFASQAAGRWQPGTP